MIEREAALPQLQTFFASQEASAAPVIADILRLAVDVSNHYSNDSLQGSIAVSYGRRVVVTQTVSLNELTRDHVIELIDYDPIKNIMLVVGEQEPDQGAILHWMVHHARDDIHISLLIHNLSEKQETPSYHIIQEEISRDPLDRAKIVLKTLREKKAMIIPEYGLFITGMTQQDITQQITSKKR